MLKGLKTIAIALSLLSISTLTFSTSGLAQTEIKLADNELENQGCSQFGFAWVKIETKNYYIYICGGRYGPEYYNGISKNPREGEINLSINNTSSIWNAESPSSRDRFVAVNGNTRYTVTRRELLITRGRRVLRRERVISWSR